MEHFPLLDIAIGLTLIYTFLSLLASELTEFLTTVLRWRAAQLQRGIMTLLGEAANFKQHPEEFKNTITGKLYSSALIASITQQSRRYRRFVGPSYIPSRVFADALLEVLQTLESGHKPAALQDLDQSASELSQLLVQIESSNQIPPRLKDNLKRFARSAETDAQETALQMQRFKHEIILWYEHSMDRLSGVYRRNIKVLSIVIGSTLALLINVDSLFMIRRISENTATRSVIVENALQIQGCETDLSSAQCMTQLDALLDETTVPIGWHPVNFRQQFPQRTLPYLLRAVAGWLLTGIAISMGAHFWFQILEQFIEVRETGEKPVTDDRTGREV
jgi:hypothetical protein